MEYNLTLSAFINTAGAVLFLVEGIAILALARGARRGRLVGVLAATWGFALIVENLLLYRTTTAGAEPWIVAVVTLPAVGFALLLARELAGSPTAGARRFLTAVCASAATFWVILVANGIRDASNDVVTGFGEGADAADAAQRLGIGARRAAEILDEVEREKGVT